MEGEITTPPPVGWLELSVEVDAEAVESVSELLAQYGYNGGVAIDQPIIPGVDGPEYRYDIARPVTLRTYLPLDAHAEEARAQIEQKLWFLGVMRPVGPLQARPLAEEDWANAWKQYYSIQRVAARTVIVPSWLSYTPQPDDLVLHLDPGMAFGTGLHPTTQLCIALLEQRMPPASDVLDLGCGSGILAITAARLGARRVLALDTDPIAVDATAQNVARNGVGGVVQTLQGSLGAGATFGHWLGWEAPAARTPAEAAGGATFDLIVANILAKVLVALAGDFVAALRPGGLLLTSGIFYEREADVVAAFDAAGLQPIERRQQGDWVALVHSI
ncbi:MAG TPA: 50S ribosomal protein L11 methyltransferase [Roseiflexaceae bacterium]|nr:50S ribosomal protein L11 methyltransferase [Roseiflexaceae bacterium]HMP39619.1 50S ribosomal protein L11 methyltransferase [Roseiflexaceae bacterium]